MLHPKSVDTQNAFCGKQGEHKDDMWHRLSGEWLWIARISGSSSEIRLFVMKKKSLLEGGGEEEEKGRLREDTKTQTGGKRQENKTRQTPDAKSAASHNIPF